MTLHTIRQTLLICFILQIGSVFFGNAAYAQFIEKKPVTTSEIGVGIGGANYKGEISPNYRFLNNQPAMTVFYRKDISAPITLRAGLMGSHRIFNDKAFRDESQDLPYHDWRDAELKLSMFELALGVEYNFLDYYENIRKPHRVSPYFFIGAALLNYNHQLVERGNITKPFDNTFTVSMPFGVGVKYALSKHWNLGLEFGARKMFNDVLDYLDANDSKAKANPHDNDMYFYNGISLSYTFYRNNCPPVYKRKAGILD
ncbi:DUF6089 family protein [uncultured Pontibacter sp.]|uniref:type IX secretion system protein PorG n=1 Tax=uncultured Pontibacter sp. TaxID=453356 RepID=UPI002622F2EE|nr:DUF6089 family protein [uncultured Pontibacter sp.]